MGVVNIVRLPTVNRQHSFDKYIGKATNGILYYETCILLCSIIRKLKMPIDTAYEAEIWLETFSGVNFY